MRTVDEAIKIALTTRDNSQAELDRLEDLQMGFRQEICANTVTNRAINSLTLVVVQQVNEVADDDDDLETLVPAAIAGGLLSALMWGVAIGREMERVDDLEKLVTG